MGGCRASCDTGRAWGQHGGGPPAAFRGEAASCVTVIMRWGSGPAAVPSTSSAGTICLVAGSPSTIPFRSDFPTTSSYPACSPETSHWAQSGVAHGVCFLHPGVMSILARASGSSVYLPMGHSPSCGLGGPETPPTLPAFRQTLPKIKNPFLSDTQ